MNWSIYAEFVGDVFGVPLAIEGFAAFMLESTFLGLWIFGWDLTRRCRARSASTSSTVARDRLALGVLLSPELGRSSSRLRGCRRRMRARRGPRPLPTAAHRRPARADRRPPGRAPRSGRVDPGFRPEPRRGQVRGAAGRCRRRGECDRHDVSPRAAHRRARALRVTRPVAALHGSLPPAVARGPEQRLHDADDGSAVHPPEASVATRRPGDRSGAYRERTPPLRGHAQRHDRPGDGARSGPEQPRPGGGARPRGDRGGGRRRVARPVSRRSRARTARRYRCRRPRDAAPPRHIRPRPPDARADQGSGHTARVVACLDAPATGGRPVTTPRARTENAATRARTEAIGAAQERRRLPLAA